VTLAGTPLLVGNANVSITDGNVSWDPALDLDLNVKDTIDEFHVIASGTLDANVGLSLIISDSAVLRRIDGVHGQRRLRRRAARQRDHLQQHAAGVHRGVLVRLGLRRASLLQCPSRAPGLRRRDPPRLRNPVHRELAVQTSATRTRGASAGAMS
jgi:hypothetical protein